MKIIESVPMWDKGQSKQATILNAYAINVSLNNSATFWYGLMTDSMELLAQGNLVMNGEDYEQWQTDEFAWDWVSDQLNLTIVGDYVEPVVTEVVE